MTVILMMDQTTQYLKREEIERVERATIQMIETRMKVL